MRKMGSKLITGVLMGCMLTSLATAADSEFVFQNGTPITGGGSNYSGAVDLALDDPARNDTTVAERLRVRYLNGLGFDDEVHSALIRFDDLESELVGEIVLSASLSLTFQENDIAWTEAVIEIYPVARPWNTVDTDWDQSEPNQLWDITGARGMPGDRGDLMSSTSMGPRQLFVTQYGEGEEFTFDLDPNVVQMWVDQPATNNGVIVVMSAFAASDVTFSSSEDSTVASRPKLTVQLLTTPDAPTDLSATAVSDSAIDLAWTDNAVSETEFEIERSVDNGPFEPLTTVGADSESYQDMNLDAETEYCYRVRAIQGVEPSGYSNEACATTFTTNGCLNDLASDMNGNCIVDLDDLVLLASAWLQTVLSYDIQPDGFVNYFDWNGLATGASASALEVREMAGQWLREGSLLPDYAPNGGDGIFDFIEFATLSQEWMVCTHPLAEFCAGDVE